MHIGCQSSIDLVYLKTVFAGKLLNHCLQLEFSGKTVDFDNIIIYFFNIFIPVI